MTDTVQTFSERLLELGLDNGARKLALHSFALLSKKEQTTILEVADDDKEAFRTFAEIISKKHAFLHDPSPSPELWKKIVEEEKNLLEEGE